MMERTAKAARERAAGRFLDRREVLDRSAHGYGTTRRLSLGLQRNGPDEQNRHKRYHHPYASICSLS
jgi:hypothetical protein